MASTDPLGSALNPIVNPKTFSWAAPVANEPQVDGTILPFDPVKEITGYLIGIRSSTKGATSSGTYPIQAAVTGAATLSDTLASIQAVFVDDIYAAAIKTVGPQDSTWSAEVFFQIHAPVPVPKPPSGFKAG